MKSYYVYIAANRHRTVFYTGMTNDLQRHIVDHKSGTGSRFTSQYRIDDLLYFEEHRQVRDAIAREKEIKRCRREKKRALVRTQNPDLVLPTSTTDATLLPCHFERSEKSPTLSGTATTGIPPHCVRSE